MYQYISHLDYGSDQISALPKDEMNDISSGVGSGVNNLPATYRDVRNVPAIQRDVRKVQAT